MINENLFKKSISFWNLKNVDYLIEKLDKILDKSQLND